MPTIINNKYTSIITVICKINTNINSFSEIDLKFKIIFKNKIGKNKINVLEFEKNFIDKYG